MSVLVYKYGLRPPIEQADRVMSELRAAHRYRNTLVEIERGRRAAQRALLVEQQLAPFELALTVAQAELTQALLEIRATRQATRKRSETEPMRARLREAHVAVRNARGSLYLARAWLRADPALTTARDRIDGVAEGLRKNARAYRGCEWGTGGLVEKADEQARQMPLYDGVEPNDPRFQRWTGEGRIGVQLQGGLELTELATDTQLRIGDGVRLPGQTKPSKHAERYRTLWMRVGSDDQRKPIWAVFPLKLDRPLPTNAIIKLAVVSRRIDGPRVSWTVELTLDTTTCARRELCGRGTVGVDLGWRVFGDEIRICAWDGDDGEASELRLHGRLLSGLSRADGLRAVRDKNFNAALAAYLAWTDRQGPLPAWMRPRGIHQWRAPGRLAGLCLRWSRTRFAGDAAGFDALDAWRKRDLHLWWYESGQRRGSLAARKDLYRRFAAWLAQRYDALVLEDFNLTRVSSKGQANAQANANRHRVATSELRLILIHAFKSRGGRVVAVDPYMSTHECPACHVVTAFDAAAHVTYACSGCGVSWDQDESAARIIRERESDAGDPQGARSENGPDSGDLAESRWAKAKRMKREKEAARNETGKGA